MRILLALSCFALLAACGKKEEKKESFTYRYNINGCDTGEQASASKNEYCSKLQNHSLNKFCAASRRKQEFEAQGCGAWSDAIIP